MKSQLLFSGAVCAIILLSGTANVSAQTTDARPLQELFQTETVYSQEKGETQFTFASKFSKSAERKLFEAPFALEYGISDRWQISFEWSATNRLTTDDGKTRGAGTNANCGMTAVVESLYALEAMGRKNQLSGAAVLAQKVNQEYERIKIFLEENFQQVAV